MMRLLLLALAIGLVKGAITTNCTTYNPALCTSDADLYCFTDGTSAIGSCDANGRICDEGAELTGFNNCTTMTTTTQGNGGMFLGIDFRVLAVLVIAACCLRIRAN